MTEQDYDLDEKSNSLSNLLSSSGYSKLRFILTVTAFTISSLVIVAIVVPVVILLQNNNVKEGSETSSALASKYNRSCFGYSISNCNIECGSNFLFNKRIVGGIEAVVNSWPSTVYIKITYSYNNTNVVTYVCGGSLIDEYTVITAAHCVESGIELYENGYKYVKLNFVDVVLGAHALDTSSNYTIRANKIIQHENFDSFNYINDIALIKLSQKAILSNKVQIACLPTDTLTLKLDTVALALGWGSTSYQSYLSNVLRQVNLTVYDSKACANVYQYVAKKSESTQICAGDLIGIKDTCQGDSGGPLFVKQTFNGKTKLVIAGLTSYGYKCAFPNSPSIYTKTSAYINWILNNI